MLVITSKRSISREHLPVLNPPPPPFLFCVMFARKLLTINTHHANTGLSSTTDRQSLTRDKTEPTPPSETSQILRSWCAEYPKRPYSSCSRSTKHWKRRETDELLQSRWACRPRLYPPRETPTTRARYKLRRRRRRRCVRSTYYILRKQMRGCVARSRAEKVVPGTLNRPSV